MLTAPFTSDQREEHRRMVETNLLGAMTATEVFLDQLRDRGGDLVNVSSVAGRVAPALARAGCRDFFVARLSEGVALRPLLPADARILVPERCVQNQVEGIRGLPVALVKLADVLRPALVFVPHPSLGRRDE